MTDYFKISLHSPNSNSLRAPKPVIRNLDSSPLERLGVSASISAEGKRAVVDYSLSFADVDKSLSTRELLKQYDFNNITPWQMTGLSAVLFERGDISVEASGSFINVQMDFGIEKDKNEPMDMVSYFKNKLDNVKTIARTDSSFSYAVAYQQHTSQTLEDVISFIDSDRTEVSTHQGVSSEDLRIESVRQSLKAATTLLRQMDFSKLFNQL
ncbi:MAG: hypothetical protein OEM38_06980 [Gammaproteobacteria bacterium]|nr:hypothetical protein [Gammaproteobacteria bacterium]